MVTDLTFKVMEGVTDGGSILEEKCYVVNIYFLDKVSLPGQKCTYNEN